MVTALISLDENSNRILNIVKARFGLKDKGEAIDFIIKKYSEDENEPELKSDFIEKIKKIENQKSIPVNNFAKRYKLK
ncbi:MAG: DUF2683 family protein [Nanoarchaeota archaeon]|nr:DUF2683 family protein [Nanoarchaeota archaeon]